MERSFDEYKNRRDIVQNSAERYRIILDYAIENPERISPNAGYLTRVVNETENLIRSNTSEILNGDWGKLTERANKLALTILIEKLLKLN